MSTNIGFRYAHTIGLLAQTGRGFSLPVDCALGPEGVLYVLNRGTPTQRNTHVTICTVDGEYRTDFGSYGAGDGQFIWPTAIVVDREGCVYISSESEHRIQKFSPTGQFISKWGTPGGGDGELDGPASMVFDRDENLYVVDHLNSRVQKFTKEGKFLLKWGAKGEDDGQFNLPWGIGLDTDGNVYVADWRNDRVQKFTLKANSWLLTVPQATTTVSSTARAASLLTETATCMSPIGATTGCRYWDRMGVSASSFWAMPACRSGPRSFYRRTRTTWKRVPPRRIARPSFLWGPTAVKLDTAGQLYIVDSCRYRIQIYRRSY